MHIMTNTNHTTEDLTREDIDHIATLARLQLTDIEREQYRRELSAILGFVGQLQEVDTDGIEETTQVTGLENVTREDIVQHVPDDVRQALLAAYPERIGSLLKVRAVFDR